MMTALRVQVNLVFSNLATLRCLDFNSPNPPVDSAGWEILGLDISKLPSLKNSGLNSSQLEEY